MTYVSAATGQRLERRAKRSTSFRPDGQLDGVTDATSEQSAQRAEVQVEVLVLEPERVLELLHPLFERHEGAAEALDRLGVQAAGARNAPP
jgi:hypothetical protein